MPTIHIDTVFNIELEFELAPFPKRLLAYGIDFCLMIIYMLVMKMILYGEINGFSRESMGIDILIVSFPMLIYSLLTELLMNGQTVGKMITGIRVISLDGGEPTAGQYIIRWITKFFEWPFLFGFVMLNESNVFAYALITAVFGIGVIIPILVSGKSQRIGDIGAGTVVVNTKTDFTLRDTIFMETSENYQVTYPEVMRLSDNDINTIKNVLARGRKKNYDPIHARVANKVFEVLNISTEMEYRDFLQKLLEDYNYLATQER